VIACREQGDAWLVQSYDAIIAARPNDLRAHCNRANALKQLGRCHEALAEYDRVLKADPDNAALQNFEGHCGSALPAPPSATPRDMRGLSRGSTARCGGGGALSNTGGPNSIALPGRTEGVGERLDLRVR
jgi:tetratricopeptide (TPR) repeat protein